MRLPPTPAPLRRLPWPEGARRTVRRVRALHERRELQRLDTQLAGPQLLRDFAALVHPVRFAEIGANDGLQHDHLQSFLPRPDWRGVMVEPVPYIFARLQRNVGHLPGVALENAAVADRDGELPFFHLTPEPDPVAHGLPSWYDGIGSFRREAVLSHQPLIPDIEQRLVETTVPTLTVASLLARHGLDGLDLLVIDTEGYDAEILRSLDLDAIRPVVIGFEHYHLTPADRDACRARLARHGYELLEEHFDTWCLRADAAPPELVRRFRALVPALPPASAHLDRPIRPDHPELRIRDEDRAYLGALYDPTTPLPDDAAELLRGDHPRLLALREAYRASGLPPATSSRWNASAVGDFLDLRYFRGDTLITWHYRELLRATRLKFLLYAMYVRDRDTHGLLRRLGEDGAFGCWTFDFPGHPTLSRDLIESVNELIFLEHWLDLSAYTNLRVLDIGAGYGRLAHRMCAAYGSRLTDYCCVDGVPESTYLADYYLRYRNCAPPARVVPLHQVEAQTSVGGFDLAVNIHSFPEMPLAAITWWIELIARLRVPNLLVIPNEGRRLVSQELDGRTLDFLPVIERAGYELVTVERAVTDPAIADLVPMHDHFHLFRLTG